MNQKDYSVSCLNGFVEINTISADGEYYYQITKPKEHMMGNWSCRIRFLNQKNVIIYANERRFAHSLFAEKFEVVKWSKFGSIAIFYEYLRSEVYDFVLLDFENSIIRRLPVDKHEKSVKDIITKTAFLRNEIVDYFDSNKAGEEPMVEKGHLEKSLLSSFFKDRWLPKIKG
ncbi:hypothetical protein [Marinoscillum sp.]|uniref:hypothetical protein n=1 Tax=Marinoscillum sp. TaxID=2024838 RepID=UPI003BACA167